MMRMRIVMVGSGSGSACFGGELSTVTLVSLLTGVGAAVVGAGVRKAKQEGIHRAFVLPPSQAGQRMR